MPGAGLYRAGTTLPCRKRCGLRDARRDEVSLGSSAQSSIGGGGSQGSGIYTVQVQTQASTRGICPSRSPTGLRPPAMLHRDGTQHYATPVLAARASTGVASMGELWEAPGDQRGPEGCSMTAHDGVTSDGLVKPQ